MTWHADPPTLARYAAGEADNVTAASVEAHLVRCDACRDALAPYADAGRLERGWAAVVDRIDLPRPTLAERALRGLGVRDHHARLLAATPSLRTSWLLSVLAVMAFAVVAGRAAGDPGPFFLLVAPLVPVAGVAAAYGPGVDAAYEIGVAAPFSGFRMLLLRTVTVLSFSLVVCGVADLAVPGLAGAAWLLPALGLSAATLAATAVTSPQIAAGSVSLSWFTYVAWPDVEPGGAGTQLLCGALLAGGLAVLALRPGRFERGEDL